MADPKKLAQALIPGPLDAKSLAEQKAIELYGANTQHNGPADAYRHLVWSGMMANKYGDIPAQLGGWLHESRIPIIGSTFQAPAEKDMDTTNNEYGRAIGKDAKNLAEILQRAKILVDKGVAKTLPNEQDSYY
jgi:hypothetical protein